MSNALIIGAATKIFADHCDYKTLQLAEQGVWPAALWAVLEETGLTQVSLPEDLGGAGGDLSDALAVLRVAGQFAVPLPIAENYLACWILASIGRSLPSGPLAVAFTREATTIQFERRADRWVLTGTAEQVGWARHARLLLVPGHGEDGFYLTLIQPDCVTMRTGRNLAGEPRDTLIFDHVEVTEAIPSVVSPDWLWVRAALTRVMMMVGALEKLLQLSVGYTGERVQCGQPLSRLQAIQQQLALLAGEVAAARIASDAAVSLLELGDGAVSVAAARIRVGEAASQATAIAHQVHGAMGYTYEYLLHFLTKRLWTWRDEIGSESEWARRLGRYIAAQGAEALWPFLSS